MEMWSVSAVTCDNREGNEMSACEQHHSNPPSFESRVLAAPAGPSVPSGPWRASWRRRPGSWWTSAPKTWWTVPESTETTAATAASWTKPSSTSTTTRASTRTRRTRTRDRWVTALIRPPKDSSRGFGKNPMWDRRNKNKNWKQKVSSNIHTLYAAINPI